MTRARPLRPSPRSALGQLMVAARTRRGLSLRALARVLGMAPSHVSNVERGRMLPSAEMVRAICAALEVPETDRDRWYAAGEMLAPGMLDALLAHPERWREVRAVLAGGGTRGVLAGVPRGTGTGRRP